MNQEPIKTSSQLCSEDFAPIRAYVRKNNGAIVALTRLIQDSTGDPVNRHMVGRWLKDEQAVQPRHGYGLALIAAYKKLLSSNGAS